MGLIMGILRTKDVIAIEEEIQDDSVIAWKEITLPEEE